MIVLRDRSWWLLAAIGIGAGIITFVAASVNLWQGIQSRSWPQTDGVIHLDRFWKITSVSYHAEISYAYEVGGVHYRGTRRAFEMFAGDRRTRYILSDYPPDTHVPVFYSPAHPADAVLEPGIYRGTWEQFGIGAVFFLVGCFPLVFGRKRRFFT